MDVYDDYYNKKYFRNPKYWGDVSMGRPHLKFLGDRPPLPHRGPSPAAPPMY